MIAATDWFARWLGLGTLVVNGLLLADTIRTIRKRREQRRGD